MVSKQLFLSRRLVREEGVSEGGVLVDQHGVIERVLSREEAGRLLAGAAGDITVVDGGELALMAGVVDSHVHVNEPGRTSWEGFVTATEAAAAGGVTTIVDMPLNSIPPTTTLENLKTKAAAAQHNIFVDVAFWGGVIPGNEERVQELVAAGVVGFKGFLCPSGVEEFPHLDTTHLEKALAALAGTGSVLALHAELEDDGAGDRRETSTRDRDPEDYSTYLRSRPPRMELSAVSLVCSYLHTTDVRVHIVHVSSSEVIPGVQRARAARTARGLAAGAWRRGVTAETCHHYLTLSARDIPPGQSQYKCAPPIRDHLNKEKLWEYLLDDKIDLVVSDHSPCTPDLKCSNNLEAWGGISSLQFGLSLFWTSASGRGVELPAVSKYLSSGPAALCGLLHKKGALRSGLDADLLYFDPDATFRVTPHIIRHKNKLTPYMGRVLKGVVKETYLRGNLVYRHDEVLPQPRGQLLLKLMQ